jgi:hypothetical protein
MKKTTTTIAMITCLTLASVSTARAQTPATEEPEYFVSVNGGGQFNDRAFSGVSTFTLFGEAGTVTANQTVGSGFVFDVSGGYRVWRRMSVAIGISTFHGSGEAASIATVPTSLQFGKPTIKTFSAADYGKLSQTDIAVNFQAVWIQPITSRVDLSLFGGPSLIHVSQDVASATETTNPTAAIKSESKMTGKAGTAGVDLSYRVNDQYSVGAFVRYAGGKVDLPSVQNLTVGGVQVGGGVRYRF